MLLHADSEVSDALNNILLLSCHCFFCFFFFFFFFLQWLELCFAAGCFASGYIKDRVYAVYRGSFS